GSTTTRRRATTRKRQSSRGSGRWSSSTKTFTETRKAERREGGKGGNERREGGKAGRTKEFPPYRERSFETVTENPPRQIVGWISKPDRARIVVSCRSRPRRIACVPMKVSVCCPRTAPIAAALKPTIAPALRNRRSSRNRCSSGRRRSDHSATN